MALAGRELSTRREISTGDLIQGMVPVVAPGDPPRVVGAAVVAIHVPQRLEAQVRAIAQAFQEYKQLKLLRQPIKGIYILLFLLMTLVIVFSVTWFGLYLARGITVPIQLLAQGTREVAAGNLDYRVTAQADDEVGILVESFNQMTAGPQVLQGPAGAGLRRPPGQARRAHRAAPVHGDGAGGRGDRRGLGGRRGDRDHREPRRQPHARPGADRRGRPALRGRLRRPGVPGPRDPHAADGAAPGRHASSASSSSRSTGRASRSSRASPRSGARRASTSASCWSSTT